MVMEAVDVGVTVRVAAKAPKGRANSIINVVRRKIENFLAFMVFCSFHVFFVGLSTPDKPAAAAACKPVLITIPPVIGSPGAGRSNAKRFSDLMSASLHERLAASSFCDFSGMRKRHNQGKHTAFVHPSLPEPTAAPAFLMHRGLSTVCKSRRSPADRPHP